MAYAIGLPFGLVLHACWHPLGLPFGLVLAYLLAYLGAPLADATNILTDFYGSEAERLSRKAGAQEIGVRSQMSVFSRMLMF